MTKTRLIYGTAWKKEQTADLVLQAWQVGFRAFDTACQPKHYREDLVGEAMSALVAAGVARQDYYVQTKFTPISGQDAHSVPYNPSQPIANQIFDSFAVSQRNLQTDYVDGLILHSPLSVFKDTLEAWRAMENIYEIGSAKNIGISNCYDFKLLQKIFDHAEIKPSILQNRFYEKTGYDTELREYCLERGITYQSFWTLTANPHILEHPIVGWLCRRYRKTPAQIFFRYLTQRGITPLSGTCDKEHMIEDLEVFEFELSTDDLHSIDNVF